MPDTTPRSRWTPEDDAQLTQMRQQGMDDEAIGLMLGRVTNAVTDRIREIEIPGEGVRIARALPDHNRTATAVEEARVALARAEATHRAAIDPVLAAIREAILKAGYLDGPDGDNGDGVWPGAAWLVLDHLRRQGIELRRVG